jgi:Mannosyl-glycoprotein endo-beta-N-acetylglucosaminidase
VAVKFVSRDKWGAKRPKAVTKLSPTALAGVAVHWFGKPRASKSHDGCAALLRSVQDTHMSPGGLGTKNGGNDIAYNHAVCPHGVAFTLRGFGVQTGANGDSQSNRDYAAVVYMAGEGDPPPSDEVRALIADVIRAWQAKGAGPLVKPHQFFTGSDCPGPDLLDWVDLKPSPWKGKRKDAAVALKDQTPDWLLDFVEWRLGDRGSAKARPRSVPKPVPQTGWEAAARIDRMINEIGPRDSFLDWVQWRRSGGKKSERPRSVPAKIPDSWKDARRRLEQIFSGKTPEPEPEPEPEPKRRRITQKSTLLAGPRVTREELESFMLARDHGGYTDANVRGIVKRYVATATSAGLDPLLVVSQMVLETGNLTSFWSQVPRRNPAGIGVTGEEGKGNTFTSWDKACRAHVGRLLAYALAEGAETPAQRALIKEALEVRDLPADRRGRAPTLAGLAGSWAMDPKYAGKIVRIANQIRPL